MEPMDCKKRGHTGTKIVSGAAPVVLLHSIDGRPPYIIRGMACKRLYVQRPLWRRMLIGHRTSGVGRSGSPDACPGAGHGVLTYSVVTARWCVPVRCMVDNRNLRVRVGMGGPPVEERVSRTVDGERS